MLVFSFSPIEITMASSSLHILCVSAIFFIKLVAFSDATLNIWYSDCSSSGTFSANSIYNSNLKRAFSSISVASKDEFHYGFFSVSEGRNAERVNSIALCRGDVTSLTCHKCLNASIHDLPRRCGNRKEAVIWYENCMLRYSDRSIDNLVASEPNHPWTRKSKLADPILFYQALNPLLAKLKGDASSSNSTRKFAYGQVLTTLYQSVYAYVQCTPDLSKQGCETCLDRAFNRTPAVYGAPGGGNVSPSCSYRYETFNFYDLESPSPFTTIVDRISSRLAPAVLISAKDWFIHISSYRTEILSMRPVVIVPY